MPKRPRPLRRVYGLFESGLVVWGATARKGRVNRMMLSWLAMIEFEPPLIGCGLSSAGSADLDPAAAWRYLPGARFAARRSRTAQPPARRPADPRMARAPRQICPREVQALCLIAPGVGGLLRMAAATRICLRDAPEPVQVEFHEMIEAGVPQRRPPRG